MAQELLFKTGEKVIWIAGVGGFGPGKPLEATILLAKRWPENECSPYILELKKPTRMRFALERDLRNEDGTRRVNQNKKFNPYAKRNNKG